MPCHLKEPAKIRFGREKSLNFTCGTAGNIGQVRQVRPGEFIEVEAHQRNCSRPRSTGGLSRDLTGDGDEGGRRLGSPLAFPHLVTRNQNRGVESSSVTREIA